MPGIRELLAEVPSGAQMPPLGWDSVTRWLRDKYANDPEQKARRKRAKRRQELYLSGGVAEMVQFVNEVFKNVDTRAKRREWVEKANFDNVIRRITHEGATTYSAPATRRVANDSDDRYQDLQRRCRQNEVMRRLERLLMLHRHLLLGFRVREENTRRVPVTDVLIPDSFDAIAHPLDPTRVIAYRILIEPEGPNITGRRPASMLVDDEAITTLDADCVPLGDEPSKPHGWSRMPWVLCSLEPPGTALLDNQTGEDLVAAHRAVWFENILLLKESKSATKLPVHIGDTTQSMRQQAADSEVAFEGPAGTVVTSIDLSMDLSLFRDTATHIRETTAGNHGIGPGQLKHEGVQSADARELMRVPLRELRLEQQGYLREVEREFAEVQSMVCAKDLQECAFDTAGWTIDFADTQTPLGESESLDVFEKKRRLGLVDTIEEMKARNPDLTDEMAWDLLEQRYANETKRNELMRPLQQISGSTGAEMPEGADSTKPPEQGEEDTSGPPVMRLMRGAK